ncbi:MAG: protein tyrosine phosphatase [Porticoccaceae bacterium]|nr:protein tyrosine phosphatase [Porticoccaceae bacterium]
MTDTPVRVLPLAGACNLRDLGGYPTTDGRRVKPGVLFRSGVMSYFYPEDHATLHRLGMRTICDLRRADERNKEPTRWPAEVQIIAWDDEPHHEAQSELSWEDSTTPEDARNTIIGLYRAMPNWLNVRLRGIFEQLAEGNVPLVFHCAAGKDRTGLSAALILHTLGVPRETILDDYELTNTAVDLGAFMLKHHKAALGLTDGEHPLQTMDPGVREVLMKADRDYLSAALDQIERDYQHIDNYVEDRLGVDNAMRRSLRDALLTE